MQITYIVFISGRLPSLSLCRIHLHVINSQFSIWFRQDCSKNLISVLLLKIIKQDANKRAALMMFSIFPSACSEGSQSPARMLELLEERGIDFFVPRLHLVIRTLCPLLSTSSDLPTFASHLPTLKGHLSTELVHAIIEAAFERVWLVTSKVDQSKISEVELEDKEEAVWEEMMEEGNLGKCVPVERQLDVLHALQVFWNEKERPKGRRDVL